LPVLFIRDLPLNSTVDLKVTQPAIYFGELPETHVFVNTKTEEFDYPRGDDNVFATYKGDGGPAARRPASDVRDRFRSTDTALADPDTESRVSAPAHQRAREQNRAFLTRPDPYWRSPMAGSWIRTLTRPATPIHPAGGGSITYATR
jgi:hypothetical protein